MQPLPPTTYHLARSARVLAIGVMAGVLGGAVASGALVSRWRGGGAGSALFWAVVVTGVVATLGLVASVIRLVRPPALLVLGDSGYRTRSVRGAGRRSAQWTDVEKVTQIVVDGHPLVVLRLHGNGQTVIPAQLIDEPMDRLFADVDERLNRAYGQRRLT